MSLGYTGHWLLGELQEEGCETGVREKTVKTGGNKNSTKVV